MRPHGSAEFLEQRRRWAIELLKQEPCLAAVARQVGVTIGAVWQWKQAYDREGEDGLKRKSCVGRGSRLTPRQRQSLMKTLDRDGLWTGPQVQRLIQQRFGVTYHVDHVGRLLHQLGYTPQLPRKQAQQRDADAIARWRKRTWPRLVKKGR
jgi:transposase